MDLCKKSRRAILMYIALLLFFALDFPMVVAADVQKGIASWYSVRDCGRATASGVPLNDNAFTAAHKRLPIGSIVRVTNLRNSKSVVVRITDRGPYKRGRIVDLTRQAFSQIAPLDEGLAQIHLEVLLRGPSRVVSGSGGVYYSNFSISSVLRVLTRTLLGASPGSMRGFFFSVVF